jgi:ABC-2 type transport system permease protein
VNFELRRALGRALGLALVLELLLAAAVLWYPPFAENIPALRALAPLPVLREIVDEIEAGGELAYVLGQHFFKACNAVGAAAAVLFAAGAVAGEAQRGTLELWLARPVSRTRLLLERYALGALSVCLPILATTATVPWLGRFVELEFEQAPLAWCALHQCAFLLLIYSGSFLASTLGRDPGTIAFAALALCVASFAAYLVEHATQYSPLRWSDVQTYMRIAGQQHLDPLRTSALVGASLACLAAACFVFRRRTPN